MTEAVSIVQVDAPETTADAAEIAKLVWATGPESYGYIFGGEPALAALIERAWPIPDTFYSADAATLAWAGETLAGVEIGYSGRDFYPRRAALAAPMREAVQAGRLTWQDAAGVADRAEKAGYLNAHVPDDVYYILALAVPEAQRGTGLGKQLLSGAIERARAQGFSALHLDVLANNPAVGFYRTMGLEIAAEITAPEPAAHGVPSEYRMTLTL